MKIVHIAPNSPYNDYWGYQDNLLPKYQKKLGHDVTIIVPNLMHKDGKIVKTDCGEHVLNDGVKVIRLPYKKYFSHTFTGWNSRLKGVYTLLKELTPDFIFFHGLISTTIFDAIKYKKMCNQKCSIVQDNHQDYNNTKLTGNGVKDFLVRTWYRIKNRRSIKYIDKVYGVTPFRATFAKEYFKIPAHKVDVLYMGADDENISFENKIEIRNSVRENHGIQDVDFLITTGGKIERTKNIQLLMQAIIELNRNDLKLIVFGQPDEEMLPIINQLSNDSHIRNIGWVNSSKVYDYFLASDLVVFPGTHSVLWEQAAACGIPLLVKNWDGMQHLDVGGNCLFLQKDSVEEIKDKIMKIYNNKDLYQHMKNIAIEKGIKAFSYTEIAKRSIKE